MNDFIPGVTDQGPARAAKGGFPYPGHGTLGDARAAAARADDEAAIELERVMDDRDRNHRAAMRRGSASLLRALVGSVAA